MRDFSLPLTIRSTCTSPRAAGDSAEGHIPRDQKYRRECLHWHKTSENRRVSKNHTSEVGF